MSTLSILLLISLVILGIRLYNANQTISELTTQNDDLQYAKYSLQREKINLQVELSKLKLMQNTDKVKIRLAWQYLHSLAKQEYLDEFINDIKDDFHEYLTKMKRIKRANRNYIEVSPIDCTRYLHSIIDEHKEWKQELLQLEEA